MYWRNLFLMVFLCLVGISTGKAHEFLEASQLMEGQRLSSEDFTIWEDVEGVVGIDQILQPAYQSLFSTSPTDKPNFGFSESVVWIKIPIRNSSTVKKEWVLQLDNDVLGEVWMYESKGNEIKNPLRHGAYLPTSERVLKTRKIGLPFQIEAGEEKVLYLKVKTYNDFWLGFTIHSQDSFYQGLVLESKLKGLFYGILAIVFLFCLSFFSCSLDWKFFPLWEFLSCWLYPTLFHWMAFWEIGQLSGQEKPMEGLHP